jgi:hypothetical protein
MKGRSLASLCSGALLIVGSLDSDAQTPNAPPIPPDDRFFLYEGPTIRTGFVGHFVQDTPTIITGAPYSGVGTTESVAELGDLGTARETVKMRYVRDGQGRTRIDDVSHPGRTPELEVVRIDDPVGGQRYMLFPYKKSMFVLPFVKAAGAAARLPLAAPPPSEASFQRFLREFGGDAIRAPGKPVEQTMALGLKTFDGIRAIGARRTYTLPGTAEPIRIESEQWFSAELGVVVMNVMSTWISPKLNLKSTYRLQATRGEPAPALLRVPADYVVSQIEN